MRFKTDENIPPDAVVRLGAGGHDVATVHGQALSGTNDAELYRVVVAEDRVLVTLDLDFANPVRFPTSGTAGILVLRVARPSRALVLRAIESLMPLLEREPLRGRLWIVEHDRIRVHTPADEER